MTIVEFCVRSEHPEELARLRIGAVPILLVSFVGGASLMFAVLFARPLSEAFWQHFGDWWGFLWAWQRGTALSVVWALLVGVSLLIVRPRVGRIAMHRAIGIGLLSGALTVWMIRLLWLFSIVLSVYPVLLVGAVLALGTQVSLLLWTASWRRSG